MKKSLRVYFDTSVIGGCLDTEFANESLRLIQAILTARIVTEKSLNDAVHVAAATVARADAIVSWNFKHIVRLDKMKEYNQLNLLNG